MIENSVSEMRINRYAYTQNRIEHLVHKCMFFLSRKPTNITKVRLDYNWFEHKRLILPSVIYSTNRSISGKLVCSDIRYTQTTNKAADGCANLVWCNGDRKVIYPGYMRWAVLQTTNLMAQVHYHLLDLQDNKISFWYNSLSWHVDALM